MFTPVKEIYEGGEGVPVPVYRGTFRGDTLHAFAKGQAHDALDWLKNRTHEFALYANINGTERLIERGGA